MMLTRCAAYSTPSSFAGVSPRVDGGRSRTPRTSSRIDTFCPLGVPTEYRFTSTGATGSSPAARGPAESELRPWNRLPVVFAYSSSIAAGAFHSPRPSAGEDMVGVAA